MAFSKTRRTSAEKASRLNVCAAEEAEGCFELEEYDGLDVPLGVEVEGER